MTDSLGAQLTGQIPALNRYAEALLGRSPDVDDLVQETLVQALRKLHVWPDVRNVRAYLFTMLHNLHMDRMRRTARQGPLIPIEQVEWRLEDPPVQEGSLELRDLKRGIRMLPMEQRQVILLVGLEGLRYREAAEVLDIPIGTVMSRLSRGREMLRDSMDGRGQPDIRAVT